MAGKLKYSRLDLLAVKPKMASQPSKLAEDCPVKASLRVGTVPVVRHAKKASTTSAVNNASAATKNGDSSSNTQGNKVSAKDREELAELKKHWHQRVQVASTNGGALDASAQQEQQDNKNDVAVNKVTATKKSWGNVASSSSGAAGASSTTTANNNEAELGDKLSKEDKKKTHKTWAKVDDKAIRKNNADIPTAPISKAAARRVAETRREVKEPEALIGDPAAQLPSSVNSLHWSLTSLSPEYYVVPVPVLVDERGNMITAVDVQLHNHNTNGASSSGAAGAGHHVDPTVVEDGLEGGGLEGGGLSRPKTRPKELSAAEMTRRVLQRERQIRLGQRTLGYKVWEQFKQRGLKIPVDASTPPPVQACSKRSWDGQVRRWRQLLHEYDARATEVFSLEQIEVLEASFKEPHPDNLIAEEK